MPFPSLKCGVLALLLLTPAPVTADAGRAADTAVVAAKSTQPAAPTAAPPAEPAAPGQLAAEMARLRQVAAGIPADSTGR